MPLVVSLPWLSVFQRLTGHGASYLLKQMLVVQTLRSSNEKGMLRPAPLAAR